MDSPEGEEGELASEEVDPDLHQGDSNLSQLALTEEEQGDFDSSRDQDQDLLRGGFCELFFEEEAPELEGRS